MRIKLFTALALMLAMCVGCNSGAVDPDPIPSEVNPLKGLQVVVDEIAYDLDAHVAGLVGKTVPELEVVLLQRQERSSNAFSTTMTADEIRQELAANIVEGSFKFPDGCTISWGGEVLTCACWVYDYAGVYHVYPYSLIGYIGIHGIFITQYTDAEIEALADALYWLGHPLPPAPPPMISPCDMGPDSGGV